MPASGGKLKCRWCDWTTNVWSGKGKMTGWRRLFHHVDNQHSKRPKEILVVYGTTEKGLDSLYNSKQREP